MNDIQDYNEKQVGETAEICALLFQEIGAALPHATSKLYHANPVWFIDENPIVGYDVTTHGVNILFWDGQDLKQPGLAAVGKFKAAGTTYETASDIDVEVLRAWLKESQTPKWDYKNLRANDGALKPLV